MNRSLDLEARLVNVWHERVASDPQGACVSRYHSAFAHRRNERLRTAFIPFLQRMRRYVATASA